MSEIRSGETFYPLTCTEGLVNRVVVKSMIYYNASGTPPTLAH